MQIYKKININISEQIYKRFSNFSNKKGLSKAKVLRNWLKDELTELKITRVSLEETQVSYSINLNKADYTLLRQATKEFQTSMNHYICNLIINNTKHEDHHKKAKSFLDPVYSIQNLWKSGEMKKIIEIYESRLPKLNTEELSFVARAANIIGEFYITHKCISILKNLKESSKHSTYIKTIIKFLTADVALLSKLHPEEMLNNGFESLKLATMIDNRRLIGDSLLIIALSYFYLEDFEKSIEYHNKCYRYIDPYNFHDAYLDNTINLFFIHSLKKNYQKAKEYELEIEKTFKLHPNKFYKTFFLQRKAANLYFKKEFRSAKFSLHQSDHLNNQTQSIIQKYYFNEEIGKVNLYQNNFDLAYTHFRKNSELKGKHFPDLLFNRSDLYRAYLESKNNYEGSLKKYQIIKQQKSKKIQNQLLDYVINATKFIQNKHKADYKQGKLNLIKLSQEAINETYSQAAKNTLLKKTLQPIW
jgi:hypothetical protein